MEPLYVPEVSYMDKVYEVKQKLAKQIGIPAHKLRLIFAGKRLDDDRTIRTYDIKLPSENLEVSYRSRKADSSGSPSSMPQQKPRNKPFRDMFSKKALANKPIRKPLQLPKPFPKPLSKEALQERPKRPLPKPLPKLHNLPKKPRPRGSVAKHYSFPAGKAYLID